MSIMSKMQLPLSLSLPLLLFSSASWLSRSLPSRVIPDNDVTKQRSRFFFFSPQANWGASERSLWKKEATAWGEVGRKKKSYWTGATPPLAVINVILLLLLLCVITRAQRLKRGGRKENIRRCGGVALESATSSTTCVPLLFRYRLPTLS